MLLFAFSLINLADIEAEGLPAYGFSLKQEVQTKPKQHENFALCTHEFYIQLECVALKISVCMHAVCFTIRGLGSATFTR